MGQIIYLEIILGVLFFADRSCPMANTYKGILTTEAIVAVRKIIGLL